MRVDGVRYISMAEVLEELEITRQTLWRWRREGKVPAGHLFRDGRLFFTEEDAEAIRAYANHIEPAPLTDSDQLGLFDHQAAGGSRD